MFNDRTYDVLDPLNEEFCKDFADFNKHVQDLEHRLSNVIEHAVDDCPALEHFLKVPHNFFKLILTYLNSNQ